MDWPLGETRDRLIFRVRNEQNFQQWEPKAKTFAKSFTDDSPSAGENRYYLRGEQADGNMAWSSPVWMQVRP